MGTPRATGTDSLAFPFHVDGHGRSGLTGPREHVRDLVEQLLFTSPGERVMRPDFGCGLLDAVFAPNSPELAATLELTVHAALRRWLGDLIEVTALDVRGEHSTLRVDLGYTLLRTGERYTETFTGPRDTSTPGIGRPGTSAGGSDT